MEYVPYVYLIKNKSTGLKYLGVRYAKGCHPNDLWTTYFTSSTSVHKLIEQFGKEDWYVKVIHKFPNNPNAAILKEASYFKYIKQRDDYINLCYSSGIIDLRVHSRAGKIGGSVVYARKIGIFRDEKERKKWASMGGKIGGKRQADLGLGFHQYKNNPELHKKWSSMGGKKSGVFANSIYQSEFGKRGGIKNKGFIWINDGVKSYKYTKKQQTEKSLEQFLVENPNYKKGRVNAKNKINKKTIDS